MEKLKKFAKEWSIFLLVAGLTLVLFGYKQINPTTYKTVSANKVASMLDADKDFVLVVGKTTNKEEVGENQTDPTTATLEQNVHINNYIKDKHEKIYYLDIDSIDDPAKFLNEKLGSDSTECPQTFLIIDGEVYRSKQGTVKYYDFSKLVADWKEHK